MENVEEERSEGERSTGEVARELGHRVLEALLMLARSQADHFAVEYQRLGGE